MLEEGPGEDDGVREDDDASRRLRRIAGELAQPDADEPDLHDFAVHVREGALQAHAVADASRRRLLLTLRTIVVTTALTLVIVFHFASELTALVTALGFAAAGIAFALQNVILALAGYFSMVAPNGIRVGDRVSLQGPFGYVRGEVLDIGLVRIRLRELDGEPLRPTGRIVVFPNSVVFTGSFFKHPPAEDRGEGPRPVERSAAA